MFDRLSDPELYSAAAERLRAKRVHARDLRPLCADGPSLAAVSGKLDGLARRLAREVGRGDYRFGPVLRRVANIEGKQRALYVAQPLDEIVLTALAEVLSETLNPQLSEQVFSYRKGRNARSAVRGLQAYLRGHRNAHPDPRTRGLHVVRRDVSGYGDAIPADPKSALWSQLTAALRGARVELSAARLRWLEAAFRPEIQERDGLSRPEHGVPTGSPLQPIACNLYLGPIDRLCAAQADGFYARYGDDMLFAHPDRARALSVMQSIDDGIAQLGLQLSPDKSRAFWFTGAGRASEHAAFRGVSAFDYLGVRCEFRGVLGLKRDKLRALLRDVRSRLEASASLLDAGDEPLQARTLCAIVNHATDSRRPLAHPVAQALREFVDDRGQLRDLDYKLACLVAETLSRRRGVRALRAYPPRKLREKAGLGSLARARDRVQRQLA